MTAPSGGALKRDALRNGEDDSLGELRKKPSEESKGGTRFSTKGGPPVFSRSGAPRKDVGATNPAAFERATNVVATE